MNRSVKGRQSISYLGESSNIAEIQPQGNRSFYRNKFPGTCIRSEVIKVDELNPLLRPTPAINIR